LEPLRWLLGLAGDLERAVAVVLGTLHGAHRHPERFSRQFVDGGRGHRGR
jgi:hypothetical protein